MHRASVGYEIIVSDNFGARYFANDKFTISLHGQRNDILSATSLSGKARWRRGHHGHAKESFVGFGSGLRVACPVLPCL